MRSISITFPENKKQRSYPIIIGNKLLPQLQEYLSFSEYSQAVVLTDGNVGPLWLETILAALPIKKSSYILPAGEKAKTIESVQKVWQALYAAGCDRKSLLINLGGGVIGDMGGFAASTYMRGIDFINIPTTLLAQVDANIGGKTGFDFAGIKNLIGTFVQPRAVIIDAQTLTTLPKREYVASFAEIIKHGFIKDKKYLEKVIVTDPLSFSTDEMIDVIAGSCEIKAAVVSQDEKESGERKLLNFGHTIGHAIEAILLESDKPLLHGEAVSIGMVAEAKLSQLKGFISENDFQLVENALQQAGLPIQVQKIAKQKFMEKMLADKKNEKGVVKFVLLKEIGKAIYDQEVSEEMLDEALGYVMKV